MRAYWLGAIILSYLVIVGCTTLSKDQCQKGNWFKIGQNDGTRGRPLSQFENHVNACGKHGIKTNRRSYQDGRLFGLARYCTPLRGFKAGRYSQTYQKVCPQESQGEFLRGYELGSEFGRVETRLRDADNEITEIETFLKKGKGTPAERQRLKRHLVKLEDEKIRLKGEIRRIQDTAQKTL